MEHRSGDDVKGIVEEMAEDRGRTMNRANTKKRDPRAPAREGLGRTLLFGGVAALVLLTASFLLIGRGGAKDDEAWRDLAERVDRIELRLDRMEEASKQIPAMIGRMEGLGKSMNRIESDQRALLDRMDSLSRRLENLSRPAAAEAPPSPPASGRVVTHTVARGETLFSIAKRYGLSVEALCRMNGIRPNEVIQPGQRLVVGRGE
jgi:LysM repeat protein